MLNTKFQGHRFIGSGEENFFEVFTIYGQGSHVGHVAQFICIKFSFLFSLKLSYDIWFQIALLFMRKTSFNFEIWMTFDQGQRMTLTFDTHSRSLTH